MSFICSSEEELNDVIKSLQYRIQHESIPLSEEKQLTREIKKLEGTREKVIARAAIRAKIQDSLGEKESIQDQVKLIGSGLDGVGKEKKVVQDKLDQLDKEKEVINKVIKDLDDEMKINSENRQKAYEKIQELRKQLDEGARKQCLLILATSPTLQFRLSLLNMTMMLMLAGAIMRARTLKLVT